MNATTKWRNVSHEAREIGYCEDCCKFTPWLTVVALAYRCLCGSTNVARGTTGLFDKV